MNELVFQGAQLAAIERDGKMWVTAPDLSRFLGYSRADKVTQLYNRHADEFHPTMTQVFRESQFGVLEGGAHPQIEVLDNRRGNLVNEVRLFSLRGAHLVAMLAKTEMGKACRRWMLDLAERESATHLPHSYELQKDWVITIRDLFGEDDARKTAIGFGWPVAKKRRSLVKVTDDDILLGQLTRAAIPLARASRYGFSPDELCRRADVSPARITPRMWESFALWAQAAGLHRSHARPGGGMPVDVWRLPAV
ncbi:hypothetical protein [Sphingomonas baiyangensis]|uniref:Bro-N domain-containing protein n=1 Tax=Sphingomonas baiyangensis TaxID=2572576 RepID=A0A4V5PTM5_9SPHN|nr:hypothetical protein [Sphingomonas baiyangensis]TKD50588.1 hypothetical protein FBR43_07275 [Sphingomonas baiyangensis]